MLLTKLVYLETWAQERNCKGCRALHSDDMHYDDTRALEYALLKK